MNQYGRRAQKHWQTHLPTQYAQISDPTAFFTTMGETLAEQIEDLAEQITSQDPPGETSFMDKLGRLNQARLSAEDEVMRESLPEPEPSTAD